MIFNNAPPQRRFFVPEVVQTSAMDCGPAALKALLEGFGIRVHYGRLREVCQTSVDGTSIDTLEVVANQLGLVASQIMVPIDHLFLENTPVLPALTVIRLPNGLTHFVIIWRNHGRFVQVMDPGIGRRWVTRKQLLEELYIHNQVVPADAWYAWACSEDFCAPLRQRLAELEVPESTQESFLRNALASGHWKTLATLDAAIRMTATLVRTGGLQAGTEASDVLTRFLVSDSLTIPTSFWSVCALPEEDTQLLFQAPVLIQVSGLRETPAPEDMVQALPPEWVSALAESGQSPEQYLWELLKKDGFLTQTIVLVALLFATLGVTLLPLLFRFLLEMGQHLDLVGERINAIEALIAFLVVLLSLQVPIAAMGVWMGRRLETHLRLAFLGKIPRLGDHYFRSRLASDMTERAYGLMVINQLPPLVTHFLQLLLTMVLTAVGIAMLSPESSWLAVAATVMSICMSLVAQPVLTEQDMRFRTHEAALSRFYLDALLGLIPIRTHGAAHAFRSEQESLLVQWSKSGIDFAEIRLLVIALSLFMNTGFVVWIVLRYVEEGGSASGVLVLLYWALRLPDLGMQMANLTQQYPMLRNRILRLLEPLHAPEETEMWYSGQPETGISPTVADTGGVAIDLQGVTVQTAGHSILREISVAIAAGAHLAIVGSSGAGKSSLVGLLLGWYHPSEGVVRVDGALLQGERLQRLRQETAWVDPSIQVWNRSLQDNLYYGTHGVAEPFQTVLDQADLVSVLERLPDAEQTVLGEGGGLVSGGEGQRVRLGRAMLRSGVKLVILDEPFRGLDREKRRQLLDRARRYWASATLIFISHDVGDTQSFQRVLVVEEGRVTEDNPPTVLLEQPNSRYRQLLTAEKAVRQELWEGKEWQHWWLEGGELRADGPERTPPTP